jgi:hypothetical protein
VPEIALSVLVVAEVSKWLTPKPMPTTNTTAAATIVKALTI